MMDTFGPITAALSELLSTRRKFSSVSRILLSTIEMLLQLV